MRGKLKFNIANLNMTSRLEHQMKNMFSMDYFKSCYYRENIKGKMDGSDFSSSQDVSDKGLTEDKGINRYYPAKSIYPNYKKELDNLYGIKITCDDDDEYSMITDDQDHFKEVENLAGRPVTEVGNYLENFKYNSGHSQDIILENLPDYVKSGYSSSLNIIPESAMIINLGYLDGILYTTTNSINAESLYPTFKGTGVEIPCQGILVDLITEIVMKTLGTSNLEGRPNTELELWTNEILDSDRNKGGRDRDFYKGFVKKEEHVNEFTIKRTFYSNMLNLEMFNLIKKEVKVVSRIYNNTRESKEINNNFYQDFLPLGCLIPLVKFFRDEEGNILMMKLNDIGSNILLLTERNSLGEMEMCEVWRNSFLRSVTGVKVEDSEKFDLLDDVGVVKRKHYIDTKIELIQKLKSILEG